MRQFNNWTILNGFNVANEKTVVSVYTRRRVELPDHMLLDFKAYPIVPSVKFLGVYIL